jgi:vancomycin resistance protein YoaR
MVETFTTGEVLVQPADIAPGVTVADLQKQYSLRFRAVTPIDSHSTDSRNENIRVAFSRINGMVPTRHQFFHQTVVGKRTLAHCFTRRTSTITRAGAWLGRVCAGQHHCFIWRRRSRA